MGTDSAVSPWEALLLVAQALETKNNINGETVHDHNSGIDKKELENRDKDFDSFWLGPKKLERKKSLNDLLMEKRPKFFKFLISCGFDSFMQLMPKREHPIIHTESKSRRFKKEKILKKFTITSKLKMSQSAKNKSLFVEEKVPMQFDTDSTKENPAKQKRTSDDQEEYQLAESKLKPQTKKKRVFPNRSGGASSSSLGVQPSPSLPEEFMREVEKVEGINLTLIIEKSMYGTDLTKNHRRVSIPFSQIRNTFLTEEEKEILSDKRAMENVRLMHKPETRKEEDGEIIMQTPVVLRQWDMKKNNGSVSSCYVLRTGWYDVVVEDKLREGDAVQIWSFRDKEQKLRLILVVVARKRHGKNKEDEVVKEGLY